MKFTVPIYIEERDSRYAARPLFIDGREQAHENLNRALTRLSRELRRELSEWKGDRGYEELAKYTFFPEDLEDHLLQFSVDLRQRTARCRFLFVVFRGLGSKLVFTPSLPGLWFMFERGETLRDRAGEVLRDYFRARERKEPDWPEKISVQRRAWVTSVELNFYPSYAFKPPEEDILTALIGGQRAPDGEAELNSVGRCLEWSFPDELDRSIFRDSALEELSDLLKRPDHQPVLLLGPRGVGKTALVHEYVYRKVEKSANRHASRHNTWLIAPQRLVSGMSFVGQWENRLLAILSEVQKQHHVIYFDDLLGLYHAGITSISRLSAAHVLKPYVERREVCLLAEMTPEAFRVFQEVDRGFADLFHILPLKEPSEEEGMRILIHVMRHLEGLHGCRFSFEVLPTVLDLQRRYVQDVAFPGKAAVFLKQMAVTHPNAEVDRGMVLEAFQAGSGLSLSFLDTRTRLRKSEVLEALSKRMIGQSGSLEAAADAVCVARARLNDPSRPLASFLFLGPTGVGKTECAKTLAAYLFGDEEKILRFDMNEFLSAASAARLVGTFENPEGLLTSAIRRQPFSVVLLDEIEKAHPDVFDLLLQVLGEGRLTDGLGRTADFSNAILVLTSNLGVREAGAGLGFGQEVPKDQGVYVEAAERFFRPEFFNRLDRVIPFERLGREHLQKIAQLLIQNVFEREGLIRRKCILQIDPAAMDQVVNEGYHPLLGARALKRAIEGQLTRPVASYLASMKPDTPTIIGLFPAREGIAVQVQGLTETEPVDLPASCVDVSAPELVLERLLRAVSRIEEEAASLGPSGPVGAGAVLPEHERYFAIREQAAYIRRRGERLIDEMASRRRPTTTGAQISQRMRRLTIGWDRRRNWEAFCAARDAHEFLQTLLDDSVSCGSEERIGDLFREAALLRSMAEVSGSGRALVYIRTPEGLGGDQRRILRETYLDLFGEAGFLRLTTTVVEASGEDVLLVEGVHALPLLKVEKGTHLFCPPHQNLVPVQVFVSPLSPEEDPARTVGAFLDGRTRWLDLLAKGQVEDDPLSFGPVIRIYDEADVTVDLRTDRVWNGLPPVEAHRMFLLSLLELPAELFEKG